ncbi:hypothetical protein A6R68_13824 [Neotoma lepida]|uniref:PH domain-containing protein n=1 Tax=Neotoma lepida TaxID=56216 RepID=A0A1A6H029_NEOLE|nr:hypothetical protein A6R68_13824 [Neotoma lepida]
MDPLDTLITEILKADERFVVCRLQSVSDLSSIGDDVVCTSWLRKLSPKKKLRCYAWKKHWFILQRGRMSGNLDILEYFKNEHSKKPLQIINLNFCEQVDVGLTFNKKELQESFVFDIKTRERTFYLVAETEADLNKWVQSVCQICDSKSSIPSHSSQPTLLPPVSSHIQPVLSTSAP